MNVRLWTTCCALALLPILAGCVGTLPTSATSEAETFDSVSTTPIVQTAENDFAVNDADGAPFEDRYYYNQLTDQQKTQYRVLYTTIITHSPMATYAGPYNDSMQTVSRALFLDCPELFYAHSGGQYQGDDAVVRYELSYVYDAEAMYAYRERIQNSIEETLDAAAIQSGIDPAFVNAAVTLDGRRTAAPAEPDDVTKQQLAWAFTEQLANRIDYHWDAAAVSDDEFYQSYFDSNTLYGALVEQHAMCGGYAQAFAHLCKQVGIPCIYVEGNVVENGYAGAHAWDLVYINGSWRVVDPTWSDDEQGIGLHDRYFLISDLAHAEEIIELYVPSDVPVAY